MRRRLAATIAAVVLTTAVVAPASAIVYGQRDEANTYANVGALIREFEVEEGVILPLMWCSGTLIAPDVFLTAAHCVLGEDEGLWISFDQPVALSDPARGIVDLAAANVIGGVAHPHPNAFCCGANDWFDVGVVILDSAPAGLTPAPLPTENLLGAMSAQELRAQTFTAVGYGAVRESRRLAFQGIAEAEGWRSYGHQSALSLTKAWFTLSMNQATGDAGTCYGDSGGPHFLPDGTVVSLTVTGDAPCKATDKTYRLDTPVARAFLGQFVSLP